jgi:hypothetical protein
MKQKNYKMKKTIVLAIITLIITSCNSKKSMDPSMSGHWLTEEFYNHITSSKNLQEYNGSKIEFIIPDADTNYTLIDFKGKVHSGPLELMGNKHLVIKNYFGNYKNADILLEDGKLVFVNNETNERISFVKIKETEFQPNEIGSFSTYTLPLINKYNISGKYLLNTDTVEFTDGGKINNLGKTLYYSFCLDQSCRISNSLNTIFLSNDINEGFYHEYLVKKDSLIIFSIDEASVNRGNNAVTTGVKYRMKKIN